MDIHKQLRSRLSAISQLQREIELLEGDEKIVQQEYDQILGESSRDAEVLEILKIHVQASDQENPAEESTAKSLDRNQEEEKDSISDLRNLVNILEYLLSLRLEFDENYRNTKEPEDASNDPEEEEKQQKTHKEAITAEKIEYYAQSNQNDINLSKIFELQILNKKAIVSINEKLKQINALQRQLNIKKPKSSEIDTIDNASLKRVKVRSAVLSELITFMITSSGHNWTRDQKLSEMIQYCGNQYTMNSEKDFSG